MFDYLYFTRFILIDFMSIVVIDNKTYTLAAPITLS